MNVQIRQESADNQQLLDMLKYTVTKMIHTLELNGIILPDNSVKIWVKQFNNSRFFPKIEFDNGRQELQFDMTHDGMIQEVHFKSFIHTATGTKRHDMNKQDANPLLQRIDNILRFNCTDFVNGG